MGVESLDHFTIWTTDVDRSVDFYERVVGLKNGFRPDFGFPGAWLYCGERPVVHLMGTEKAPSDNTGTIDHVAFRATDFDGMKKHLEGAGLKYDQNIIKDAPIKQLFVTDPDGVRVELNFFGES